MMQPTVRREDLQYNGVGSPTAVWLSTVDPVGRLSRTWAR